MAVQGMGGFAARAMAGRGAMQQQQVQAQAKTQAQNQAQAQTRTQTQARTQNQSGAPEMSTGRVMNMSDLGSGQQTGNQAAASGFGGAEIQFSERSGVTFGGKG